MLEGSFSHDTAKLFDLIQDIRIAFLTTREQDGTLRGRPMATQVSKKDHPAFDGSLWFFTRLDSTKSKEIEDDADVQVSYVDKGLDRFISVSGSASIVQDSAKIDELWNDHVAAWFEQGKNDPQVALIRVKVSSAEYWAGPSNPVVKLFERVKEGLGRPYATGEHAKVEVL